MRSVQRTIAEVSAAWHRFWFAPSDPLPLSVMRLLVGAMLFYTHLVWSLDLLGFFGASGWNNAGIIQSLQQDTLSWSLWWFVPPGAEFQFHVCCLAILFLFWIGFATRLTSVLAWVITVSYAHRSMLANFGLDQINAMLAFYLMLAPCGARLSVDALWRKRRERRRAASEKTGEPSASAALATRLIQVHICVIYFWAGLSKLQGSSWWTGDALWHVIANYEYQSLDLTWLANYPAVLQLATHGVLFFEITFPLLIFHHRLRPVPLLLGIGLHLGIGAFLGMWTFGLIMICGYVAFLSAEDIRWATSRIAAFSVRRRASSGDDNLASDQGSKLGHPTSPLESPVAIETTKTPLPDTPLPDAPPSRDTTPAPTVERASAEASPINAATVRIANHFPAEENPPTSARRKQRYVTDKLFYVARSKQQRANVRVYFHRHKMACCVLRGAAELIERTVNLRKATIVLRAKDFSPSELQFWCEELVETNPDGQFRIFLLPDTKQKNTAEGLEVPTRVHLFRLSATTTLRRIRKLYTNQDWDSEPKTQNGIRAAKLMSWMLMMFLLVGCGAKKDTPKIQLERARMMLERGQLHESVQAFTTALSATDGDANDYYDRGVAYERLKQLEQAANDYTEALRLAPMHAQALNNRAVVLAQLGRVEEALLDLSQAIEINPTDALAWSNRALARHESGDFAAAIGDYTQSLELSKEARLYFQRGNTYADFSKPEQAAEDFTAAINLDADFVRAYLNRANAFVQLGRLDEAVQDMQTASRMDRELSMAGAVQQLERQIRGERWQVTAVAGVEQWLKTKGYTVRQIEKSLDQPDRLSPFTLAVDKPTDSEDTKVPLLVTPTGPRGAPVFEASLSQKLIVYDKQVALLVVDKQELIQADQEPSAEQPSWLKDWRFQWKPLDSDFVTSEVEVLLGPPAD